MPEEETGLPGEMKEIGTHPHHEEPTAMPEMFGEKGERYKLGPTRQALTRILGVKKVKEISGAIKEIEFAGLKQLLSNMDERHIEELRAPEKREELLRTNDELRGWMGEGSLNEKEEGIARKVITFNVRQLEKSRETKTGGVEKILEEIAAASKESAEVQKKMIGKLAEEILADPERLRDYVIGILEGIESNNNRLKSPENSPKVDLLKNLEGDMDLKLKTECQARLRLHESFTLVEEALAAGGTKDIIDKLKKGSAELQTRSLLIEGEDFHLFFVEIEGLPGLKIKEAFDLLQEVANKGREIGERVVHMHGKELSGIDENLLVEQIVKELGGDHEARKSLQLAQRLATITFENSAWDRHIHKNPISRAFYFKDERLGNLKGGGDIGPPITILDIEGIGASYFRWATLAKRENGKKVPLIPDVDLADYNNFDDRVLGLELREAGDKEGRRDVLRREYAFVLKNRGYLPMGFTSANRYDEEFYPLRVDRYPYKELARGDLGRYWGGHISRVLEVQDWLLKTSWSPKEEIKDDTVRDWVAKINPLDSDNILRLRRFFALGLLDSGLKSGILGGWGAAEAGNVIGLMTKRIRVRDPESGKWIENYFLPKKDLSEILKIIKADKKMRGIVLARDIQEVMRVK